MSDDRFPHNFDPTASVLFLGAGFSRSAINLAKGNPPVGDDLSNAIKELAGIPLNDPSDLKDIATYAINSGKNVFGLLSDLYTITKLSNDQISILSQPWLRIYTTNYDDCVELYQKSKNLNPKEYSFSIDSSTPSKFKPGAVVHLHGYIHSCQKENLPQQLILSHYSYAQQAATQSPWWDLFERDLRIAKNIFFVGYDLKDFEPAKYLTKNPSAVAKTFFILRPAQSPVAAARLGEYGHRSDMGVEGFATECKTAVVVEKPQHTNALSAFRFVDLLKDNKSKIRPTTQETQALFAFGNFNFQRLLSTHPKSSYVFFRADKIAESIDALQKCRTLILHSKVGNGKTIFRQSLSVELSQRGYSCFELRDNLTPPQSEIDFLSTQPKPVVFFTSYDSAYANIHLFNHLKDEAKFIIEITTGTLQVRHSEVVGRLPGSIERIDLNRLNQDDCSGIMNLLDGSGILPPLFKQRFGSGGEFRDIVLSLFDNPNVAKRVDNMMQPVLSVYAAKAVLFGSAILKAVGVHTDPSFLRDLSGSDSFQILQSAGEQAYEFVDFSLDRIEPHSALFSEFIVRRYLVPAEIVAVVYRMAAVAARRMRDDRNLQSERVRLARATLGALTRFGFLDDLLRIYPDRGGHIEDFYEQCRSNNDIQQEPLFWLQFSIFMRSLERWDLAESHMRTAYDRSAARPGFLTYQLDTNYLGLCLALEAQAQGGNAISRFETISGLLDKMKEMLGDGSHRGHALKVLQEIEPFIGIRRTDLRREEAVSLVYRIRLLIGVLESLSAQEKAEWGSEQVRASLEQAVGFLV